MTRNLTKEPTFTSLVEEALRLANDFCTIGHLRRVVPELTHNRCTASLAHLRKYRAVDFMEEDGVTYWFATPTYDTRSYQLLEKTREEPGSRKPRKSKR